MPDSQLTESVKAEIAWPTRDEPFLRAEALRILRRIRGLAIEQHRAEVDGHERELEEWRSSIAERLAAEVPRLEAGESDLLHPHRTFATDGLAWLHPPHGPQQNIDWLLERYDAAILIVESLNLEDETIAPPLYAALYRCGVLSS